MVSVFGLPRVPGAKPIDSVIPVEILGHRGQVIKAVRQDVRQDEVTGRIRVAQDYRSPSCSASKRCPWHRGRGLAGGNDEGPLP